MGDDLLYRLALASQVPDDAWRTRLQWTSAFAPVAGIDDASFVKLSPAVHVESAAAAFLEQHAGADVMLLCFSMESMKEEADLVCKPQGEFVHVHDGPIPYACLVRPPRLLALGEDGKHILPPLGTAAAEADAERTEAVDDSNMAYHSSDDDNGTYDGCAATGMYG